MNVSSVQARLMPTPARAKKAEDSSAGPADPGQVYVTGEGFVQDFGPIASSNGTLRVYENNFVQVLAKDIVFKDGLHVHNDTASSTVSFQRPDGAKVDFEHSDLKLPYTEPEGLHTYFEVRTNGGEHAAGFVENVFSDGDWNITQYQYRDGERHETELPLKTMTPDQRWENLKQLAAASNANTEGFLAR